MNAKRVVLVTGASGFIGRHVSQHLRQGGWFVVGLDAAPLKNTLGSLDAYYSILLPDALLDDVLMRHEIDFCIHCAGGASVNCSVSDPAGDFRAGPCVTFGLLNALRRIRPRCRFVFVSSAAVYGKLLTLPADERHRLEPISPYGYHKWQGELLCQEFTRIYDIPTAVVRIFSAYGPGLRRQVIWDIAQKALSGKPILLQGTGNESRDFIHVSDIARGLEAIALSSPMQAQVYNLASGREVTVAELVRLILAELGVERSVHYDGIIPKGMPVNWRADISRLAALGFLPRMPLEQGLREFTEWCSAELSALAQ